MGRFSYFLTQYNAVFLSYSALTTLKLLDKLFLGNAFLQHSVVLHFKVMLSVYQNTSFVFCALNSFCFHTAVSFHSRRKSGNNPELCFPFAETGLLQDLSVVSKLSFHVCSGFSSRWKWPAVFNCNPYSVCE